MIVILSFYPDHFSLNLDLMRKRSLLNFLKRDRRFDIVFALNIDHYPDLISISIGKKYIQHENKPMNKRQTPGKSR